MLRIFTLDIVYVKYGRSQFPLILSKHVPLTFSLLTVHSFTSNTKMPLESTSKQYFSSLNALAEKIAADIQNTQEAYRDLWNTLSKNEQNQAIDESIINPSAVIKYANSPLQVIHILYPLLPPIHHTPNRKLLFQSLKENYSYSWFTKSQLNLFTCLDLMGYSKPEKPLLSITDADQNSKHTKTKESLIESGNVAKGKNEKPSKSSGTGRVLKPKTPPPPPPAKVTPVPIEDINLAEKRSEQKIVASGDTGTLPKTGFDFLDNW